MKSYPTGSAVHCEWVSSDYPSVNTISVALFTASETIVASGQMTNSGGGGYGAFVMLPDTPGNYRVQMRAHFGTAINGTAIEVKNIPLLVELEGVD